jgi:hypothetical protein
MNYLGKRDNNNGNKAENQYFTAVFWLISMIAHLGNKIVIIVPSKFQKELSPFKMIKKYRFT